MNTFTQLVQSPRYTVEHAALLLAKEIAYDDLNIAQWLHHLDTLSQAVETRPTDTPSDLLRRLNTFLFEQEGFRGNEEAYYDPRNSFLNEVLARGVGIPITLSVVYMALARRLGLAVYGVGLPGHFIVGCQTDGDPLYLDPFNGGLFLDESECAELAREFLPAGMVFSRAFLLPQSNTMILRRMLNNLQQIYLKNGDAEALLRVLLLLLTLSPQDANLYRDAGIVATHQKKWGMAVRHLRHYLLLRPQAADAETMRTLLANAVESLSKLN